MEGQAGGIHKPGRGGQRETGRIGAGGAGGATYQAQATRRALEAADKDTLEAAHARVDQNAPRVTIVARQEGNTVNEWLTELPADATFDTASDGGHSVAVTGWFRLINDGHSTAIVRLPAGVWPHLYSKDIAPLSWLRDSGVKWPTETVIYLAPGSECLILAESRQTVSDWLAGGEEGPTATITATDTFADGVDDTTVLRFVGQPLVKSGPNEAKVAGGGIRLIVEPTVRLYRQSVRAATRR